MYEYKATVTRVIDGDTIDCVIDLGFRIFVKERFRLTGINAPEMRGQTIEAGTKTKNRLAEILTNAGLEVTLKSQKGKQEKYGRWLAIVFVAGLEKSVNQALIDEGLAVSFME